MKNHTAVAYLWGAHKISDYPMSLLLVVDHIVEGDKANASSAKTESNWTTLASWTNSYVIPIIGMYVGYTAREKEQEDLRWLTTRGADLAP